MIVANTDSTAHFLGHVEVTERNRALSLVEHGHFESSRIMGHNYSRWTFSPDGSRLDLAHLRFGPAHPVDLVSFDLTAPIEHGNGTVEYRALAPHRCRDDLYHATLRLEPSESQVGDLCHPGDMVLTWRITGPHKNQTLVTRYSPEPAGSHVVKM